MIDDYYSVFNWKTFFQCVGFFSCVSTPCFCFVFVNFVAHSFYLFHFYMLLPVWICVVHNQLCTHLLAGLIFMFACAFAGLSNFL